MSKLISATLAIGLAVSGSVAAETLSYGSYVARTHNLHTESIMPFFEAVTSETDGELEFRLHSDGTVVGASNALNGLRDGVVDMALVVDVYSPSAVPTNATLSELALFSSTTAAGTAATTEMTLLHCEQCLEDWKKVGVQPLGFYSTAPYHLMCRDEVNDISSLTGKRVRATTAWAGWTAAMGAIPVNVSSGETYEAISRGTVDCGLGSTAWLKTYGLADVVGYVLDLPIGAYRGGSFLNMRLEKWNGLSDSQQDAIRDNLAEAVANAAWSYEEESASALEEALNDGVELVEPGDGIKERYSALLEKERDRVIAMGKERNVRDPEALVDKYLELLKKWEDITAGLDGSREAFVSELDKHVFQKVDF